MIRKATIQKTITVPSQKKSTGNYGEQLAARYLESKNYTIIATNWRCATGEIDLVAQSGTTIIFVEVRTRRTPTVDAAFASITPAKREKLIQLAYSYIDEHQLDDNTLWRIDVIAIALPAGKKPVIEHAEDALGW